jgi:hypothetical protein
MKTTKDYYITKIKANDKPYYIVNEYGVAYPITITDNLNDARALVDKLENEQTN